jgi:hypothetical protein
VGEINDPAEPEHQGEPGRDREQQGAVDKAVQQLNCHVAFRPSEDFPPPGACMATHAVTGALIHHSKKIVTKSNDCSFEC